MVSCFFLIKTIGNGKILFNNKDTKNSVFCDLQMQTLLLKNQIYIFGKQHSRIHRLKGKVDVVITDSPLINSIVYDVTDNQYLKALVLHEFDKLNTLNYFLKRGTLYNPNGRMQTMEDALRVDEKYKELLDDNKIPYHEIEIGVNNTELIVDEVISYLAKLNEQA